jgi:hypothetical protein
MIIIIVIIVVDDDDDGDAYDDKNCGYDDR